MAPHNTQCTYTFYPLGADPLWAQKPSPPSPPGKHRLLAEERTWHLVTGKPSWLCWAHLKVLQTSGQCVFLRGLTTKDGLFPLGGWRDDTPSGHWILSLSPGSLPSLTHAVNPRHSRKKAGSPSFCPRVGVPAGTPRNWALGQEGLLLKVQTCRLYGQSARAALSPLHVPRTPTRKNAPAPGQPRQWVHTSRVLLQQVSVYVVVFPIWYVLKCWYFSEPLHFHTHTQNEKKPLYNFSDNGLTVAHY